ncbi:Tunicamycin resistance protein [compost metagenome]
MINGAFGSGKTSAAHMLQPLIPNSMIYDPEEVGFMIRKIISEDIRLETERTDDFQDIELWRVLTVKIAQEVKMKYNKQLIVPMTIYKIENFDYIHNGFKDIDRNVKHFCLEASEETLRKRLSLRGDTPGGWTYQQISKCVQGLSNERFEKHINTNHKSTDEVVEEILLDIGKEDW